MSKREIIQRLKIYLKLDTDKALAEFLGVSVGAISSWKSRNSIDFELIIDTVQGIDLNWLINGDSYSTTPNYINTTEFVKKRERNLSIPVVLIPEKAKAGYLSGFDTDYIDELPTFNFKDYTNGHKYRAFEIEGDSMLNALQAGDLVLCEKLEHLQYLKPNTIYILHTNEGLLCKRVKRKNEQELILYSDNVNYKAITINSANIIEIWKVLSLHRQF